MFSAWSPEGFAKRLPRGSPRRLPSEADRLPEGFPRGFLAGLPLVSKSLPHEVPATFFFVKKCVPRGTPCAFLGTSGLESGFLLGSVFGLLFLRFSLAPPVVVFATFVHLAIGTSVF